MDRKFHLFDLTLKRRQHGDSASFASVVPMKVKKHSSKIIGVSEDTPFSQWLPNSRKHKKNYRPQMHQSMSPCQEKVLRSRPRPTSVRVYHLWVDLGLSLRVDLQDLHLSSICFSRTCDPKPIELGQMNDSMNDHHHHDHHQQYHHRTAGSAEETRLVDHPIPKKQHLEDSNGSGQISKSKTKQNNNTAMAIGKKAP